MVLRSVLRALQVTFSLVVALCVISLIAIGGYVEPHILARQDHQPHPDEQASVPCEYKGGDFYCTAFEARFLSLSGYEMGAIGVSVIALAALEPLLRKGNGRKRP